MSKEDFSIYWPGTDIVKSRNNGFTMGLRQSDDEWRSITAAAAMKAASTSQVERSRKDLGVDPGTFYGISRKADEAMRISRHGGAYSRATARRPSRMPKPKRVTKAQLLRDLLATGPKSGRELADALGTVPGKVRPLLDHDLSIGKVVVLRDKSPYRFSLASAA